MMPPQHQKYQQYDGQSAHIYNSPYNSPLRNDSMAANIPRQESTLYPSLSSNLNPLGANGNYTESVLRPIVETDDVDEYVLNWQREHGFSTRRGNTSHKEARPQYSNVMHPNVYDSSSHFDAYSQPLRLSTNSNISKTNQPYPMKLDESLLNGYNSGYQANHERQDAAEISFVSESRLIPSNHHWQDPSGLLASLAVAGSTESIHDNSFLRAVGSEIVHGGGGSIPKSKPPSSFPQFNNNTFQSSSKAVNHRNVADSFVGGSIESLEQSMTSDSLLLYLGKVTSI
jgi:hypothetical protein